MKGTMKNTILPIMVFLIFVVGCGSTRTMIRTDPAGAQVFVGEKEKLIGTTPAAADLDKYLGFGQSLGLGVPELLLKFRLEGYEEELTTVNQHGGSLFSSPQWPGEVFVRLKEKKKKE